MMYNENISSNSSRGSGALEISLHARQTAKAQVALLAELQAEATQRKLKSPRWSIAHILTSLKIF